MIIEISMIAYVGPFLLINRKVAFGEERKGTRERVAWTVSCVGRPSHSPKMPPSGGTVSIVTWARREEEGEGRSAHARARVSPPRTPPL